MHRVAQPESRPADVLWGLALVWILDTALSGLVVSLAFSGKLWNLGFPSWLIAFAVLVGVWQWVWVAPVLIRAKRRNRYGFYTGVLTGAISFAVVNIPACLFLFFQLRHFSMQ